jgi:hypothetical protein
MRMDPKKIEVVKKWKEPKNKKGVQQFLGFCNFFRRFIRGFSKVARPLSQLTGNLEWKWTMLQQIAFENLKNRIIEDVVLTIPRDDEPFRVEADSSDYANGAVLSQKVDGKWKPVAFRSRSLNETERNYQIYDKEMMAIMDSLSEWRQYLMGAKHAVEVFTDHQNLQYFKKPQKLNRRQARWATELSEYNIQLFHKPGKSMGKADILSRMTGLERGENDNENIVLLKPEMFLASLEIKNPEDILLNDIRKRRTHLDDLVKKNLEIKEEGWEENNGIITWQNRIYIPKDRNLRGQIITTHHDSILGGHPGQYKTLELITRNYWWPGMKRDVKSYVESCEKCQETKIHRNKPVGLLNPHDIPQGPWETVGVDMIGELPEAGGYNAIVVFSDKFTKRLQLVPSQITLTSEGMAKIYRDKIFAIHGLPRKFIHDRGPQFHSGFMKELYKLLGIKGNFTTAYHPQTNGQTERMNQEIEHYLRLFINYHQNDWHEWLPLAEFVYNDREHSATKVTPFYADNGRHPYKGTATNLQSNNPTAQEFADQMKQIREEVESSLHLAANDMKRYYDKNRQKGPEYKPGDKVWLEATNLKTDRPMKKLDNKRFGPMEIIKKVGKSAYKLKIPQTWKKVHPVFNEVILSPYKEPVFPSQSKNTRPPPDIIGEEEEYEVEEIVDSRKMWGKVRYKVKWKGYGPHEMTWEPIEHLKRAQDVLYDFHTRYPTKPQAPTFQLKQLLIPSNPFAQRTPIVYLQPSEFQIN